MKESALLFEGEVIDKAKGVQRNGLFSSPTFTTHAMDPRKISILDFTYSFTRRPDRFLQQSVVAEQDASRLLVYQEGKITDTSFPCHRIS